MHARAQDDSLTSAGPGGRDSARHAECSGRTPDSIPEALSPMEPTHVPCLAQPSRMVYTVTICFPVQSRICSCSIRISSKSFSSLISLGEGCYLCLRKWGDRLRAEKIFSFNMVCRESLRTPAWSWAEIWSRRDRPSFLCAMGTRSCTGQGWGVGAALAWRRLEDRHCAHLPPPGEVCRQG